MLTGGQKLGHYKILSAIGAGGMGEVYLVQDTKLDRKVALKILPPEFAEDADRMSRFVREAKSVSALNHPNIITIHEIGVSDGTHFIATEFIEGETLHSNLKKQSLNLKSVLEMTIQVVSALDAAHRAGIVHRDIKPENVMIRPDGVVKILDFGIAKLSSPPVVASGSSEDATAIKPQSTSPGMIVGTANYMSPEQAKGKDIDARSDIFSFGIVFYEMLTGRRAFEGETALESISSILKDEPQPISRILPEIPNEIERIVNKTLRKDRDERYQTAKDLLIDLKDAKHDLEFQNKLERTVSPARAESKTQILQTTTLEEINQTITNQTVSNKPKTKYLLIGLLSLIILAGGFFGYKYLSPTRQIESIAVMPFVNESGNADNEYLSDGMTETLISNLSQLPNLNVKARSSVFRYKGKEIDLRKIAAELNVQAILTGRIAQRGEQLILNLELVDAQTENVIWSETYTRKQSDLVSLQSEIARDVSNKLRAKLSGAEQNQIAKNYTTNTEAYQLYLRGRFYWNKNTPENSQKAIELFNQAIAIDPNYALAYAGIADAYPLLSFPAKAKEAALKALSLDNNLAEAHSAFGRILLDYDYDFAAAEREFKTAIELNPNYPTVHHRYGILLSFLGRHEEAFAEYRRALELDPLSLIINGAYGNRLIFARRYDEAIAQLKKTLELDANFLAAHLSLDLVYQIKGNYAESIEERAKVSELLGNPQEAGQIRESFAKGGWEGFLRYSTGDRRPAKQPAYATATFHAALGEKDKAFAELNKSYENREPLMIVLKVDPRLDPLRSDPRFQELLRRVGFTP